ncbi:Membrane protein OS=Streptomyces antimycoticus OX=68175 GN=SANT12839_043780 PE=4 SV=1 [Streptomyces antimycoticus]
MVWGAVGAPLIGQLATAIGAGWSVARTAGLTAAVLTAALLTLTARLHRADGGPLAPLVGEDNRLSTSRAVAAAWLLIAVFAVLVLGVELAVAPGDRQRLTDGLALDRAAGLLTVAALTCVTAVLARLFVAARVRAQRLQKVRAVRPRAADLLTDDAGRGSFADVQYVVVHTAVLACTAVRLGREPWRLPDVPWGLALLAAVSVVMYLTGKYAEGGRPTVLSVVRVRPEEGAIDRDAPIRTGDDIEIRGSGFVPPGAQGPDLLAKLVVRIGTVHVHVPLVPVAGGFSSPTDTALTVPVPVDVEPGRVDVQVVTASGAETNPYPIDVMD